MIVKMSKDRTRMLRVSGLSKRGAVKKAPCLASNSQLGSENRNI